MWCPVRLETRVIFQIWMVYPTNTSMVAMDNKTSCRIDFARTQRSQGESNRWKATGLVSGKIDVNIEVIVYFLTCCHVHPTGTTLASDFHIG